MNIVCAETVLSGKSAFQTVGECTVWPDRDIIREQLLNTDALIIRSKTNVDATLLEGTPVQFVGTATAGTDHIDTDWLDQNHISWSAAPGCNANSVSEYITAALLHLTQKKPFSLNQKTIGIIGCGNVGRAVIKKAQALQLKILQNDPPRAAQEPDFPQTPLASLLPECDIVTLHTPLTKEGSWPTAHLASYDFFESLKPGAIFINAARGGICDYDTWLHTQEQHLLTASVLDVWNPEPQIRPEYIQHATLATPHIAGHSFEGKFNGTLACYQALCQKFNLPPSWDYEADIPEAPVPDLEIDAHSFQTEEALLHHIIQTIYSIQHDDQQLRTNLPNDEIERAIHFDQLRKNYPLRREYNATQLRLHNATEQTEHKLSQLGFQICF
jgi:erythronate-4-phosphate dehydrogenase